MNFIRYPQSSHPNAILRPLTAPDLARWAAYIALPLVHEHTTWNLQSVDELEPFLSHSRPGNPDGQMRLAIAAPGSNLLIGTIGFHTVSSLNKSAELAYDLSPEAWGQGIAVAAAQVMTDWAHREVGMIRVQACVLESNQKSMTVLERCGFQREGLLHSYRQVRGRSGDFFMYSHVVQPVAA